MAIHSELLSRHRQVLPDWMALYYQDPIAIVDGEGRYVVDAEGNRYPISGGKMDDRIEQNSRRLVDSLQALR